VTDRRTDRITELIRAIAIFLAHKISRVKNQDDSYLSDNSYILQLNIQITSIVSSGAANYWCLFHK